MNSEHVYDAFEQITDEILAIDETLDIVKNVDDFLDLLSKRELLIEDFKEIPQGTHKDKTQIARIKDKNLRVTEKYERLMTQLMKGIKDIKDEKLTSVMKKKANRGYLGGMKSNNGFFIDNKK